MKLVQYVVHSVANETVPAQVRLEDGSVMDVHVSVATVQFADPTGKQGTLKYQFPLAQFTAKMGDTVQIEVTVVEGE